VGVATICGVATNGNAKLEVRIDSGDSRTDTVKLVCQPAP